MGIDEKLENYRDGKIILIDKPLNWTSFDVVNKIRWALRSTFKIKKLKVGHAGTLDPLATGLLIICTGKFTKIIEHIQDAPKEYVARIALGATTPSYDMETEINEEFPIAHINKDLIEGTLTTFLGKQNQLPPIFSAKKIDGKPAYDYARKNQEVVMKPKEITFHAIELEKYEPKELIVRIRCSKGTYIRSFAYDLGKALRSGAYLAGLERTKIGSFDLENAWDLTNYIEKIKTM
ncbi:MAG: tRNA pseudouridine(55) synthase TruB [Salinivirgaceae bacterium]